MKTKRQDINVHLATTNGVYQMMLIGDASTPQTMLFSLQWLRLAYAFKGMLQYVAEQHFYSLHDTSVARPLPIKQVVFGFGKDDYFHRFSIVTTRPFPFLMSSCPWRMISAISGDDIRYSVSSIDCFFVVIRFNAFTAFFINVSSSAMRLSWRNNSA